MTTTLIAPATPHELAIHKVNEKLAYYLSKRADYKVAGIWEHYEELVQPQIEKAETLLRMLNQATA